MKKKYKNDREWRRGITAKGASRFSRAWISWTVLVAGRKASSSVQQLTAVVHRKCISTSSVLFDFLLLLHQEKKKKLFFLGRPLRSYDCALVYFYASRSKILIGRYMEPISLRTVWNRDGNRYMGGHCCAISFPISFVSPFSLDIRFFVY